MTIQPSCCTGITFSPVQEFIEKSRKLRDLYGSSYLLSYLSWSICHAAQAKGCQVISPAPLNATQETADVVQGMPNVIQGIPNKILIWGDLPEREAKAAFDQAWSCVTETCQEWIRQRFEAEWRFEWKREWQLWAKYAWEFFWVQEPLSSTVNQAQSLTAIRQRLEARKRSRNWTGINWQGESSTLSGTDAVAQPQMGAMGDPRRLNYQAQKQTIEQFYQRLSEELGEAFIDPDEELNIPELAKRLITHPSIAQQVIKSLQNRLQDATVEAELKPLLQTITKDLKPDSFSDLNRLQRQRKPSQNQALTADGRRWTGWFHGDGDRAGHYLDGLDIQGTRQFSQQMRQWGASLKDNPPPNCRVIYAGGDDFLGVFYRVAPERDLNPVTCVDYLTGFKSTVWDRPEAKPITPSIGFVWAGPQVPQRDVLQHCREAERSAKEQGRDRLTLRILFNSGNYLQWVCPWRFLPVLQDYRDREGNQNWVHLFKDVAALEARHAFAGDQAEVALALFRVYFQPDPSTSGQQSHWQALEKQRFYTLMNTNPINWEQDGWWNGVDSSGRLLGGILGDRLHYTLDGTPDGSLDIPAVNRAINNWIVNLAKVGFHLCSNT